MAISALCGCASRVIPQWEDARTVDSDVAFDAEDRVAPAEDVVEVERDESDVSAATDCGRCEHWEHVAMGVSHTCGTYGGTIYCWGSNANAELGAPGPGRSSPARGPDLADVRQLAAGDRFTCARLGDGAVWCWGDLTRIGCFTPPLASRTPPARIPDVPPARDVIAWSWGLCVVTETGRYCAPSGAVFSVTNTSCPSGGRTRFAQADRLPSLGMLACGSAHCCGVDQAGTLACTGDNSHGQIGSGTRWDAVEWVRPSVGVVRGMSLYGFATCTWTETGEVDCWGSNYAFGSGVGIRADVLVPHRIDGLRDVVQVARGMWFGCALRGDSVVLCWGDNSLGQLGDDRAELLRAEPAVVGGLPPAARISCAFGHCCAVSQEGSLHCWGLNTSGQVGAGLAAPSIARPQRVRVE